MSTLIPHVIYKIDASGLCAEDSARETYKRALQKNKNGIILDFRFCDDRVLMEKNIEAFRKIVRKDCELITLFNFDQLNNLDMLKLENIEIAVVVSEAKQITHGNLKRLRQKPTLIIQAETKKELLKILKCEECHAILNRWNYSVLPNISNSAIKKFSAREYFNVAKKFKLNRDYRFPLVLGDGSQWKFVTKTIRCIKLSSIEPKISFVIPFNNCFEKINESIKNLSLAAEQAKTSIEIIAVKNNFNHSDASEKRVLEILSDLTSVYLLEQEHLDTKKDPESWFIAGHARNAGAHHAEAEYICFIDSDISVDCGFVEKLMYSLQNQSVVQFKRVHGTREEVLEPSYWLKFYNSKNWPELKNFWRYTCTYALAMPKDLFTRSGQFQEHFVSYGFEDVDLGYRLSAITKQFHLCDYTVRHPELEKKEIELLYRVKRFGLISNSASLFFLDHLSFEVGHLVRNFLRWEHFKARVSLCNVFFQDKHREIAP